MFQACASYISIQTAIESTVASVRTGPALALIAIKNQYNQYLPGIQFMCKTKLEKKYACLFCGQISFYAILLVNFMFEKGLKACS